MPIPPWRSPSVRLATAVLLVVPITLLGACGGQGDGNVGSGDETDSGPDVGADTEPDDSPAETTPRNAGPLSAEMLAGEWGKVDDGDPSCADYPDQLTFESFGYLASLHDDRAVVLDGGSYEVDGDRLIMSNPLDAMVSFPATLADDVLALDTGDCIVRYQRLGPHAES